MWEKAVRRLAVSDPNQLVSWTSSQWRDSPSVVCSDDGLRESRNQTHEANMIVNLLDALKGLIVVLVVPRAQALT